MTPAIAAGLVRVYDELGIPVDSLAAVMSAESGLRPGITNPEAGARDAADNIWAAGLMQLSPSANLPGFKDQPGMHRIPDMTVAEQFEEIVLPYYRRIPSARGVDPGTLRMLQFVSAKAHDPDDTVVASVGDPIYSGNWGFDRGATGPSGDGGKGFITVGDVKSNTESRLALAHGARVSPAVESVDSLTPSVGNAGTFIAVGIAIVVAAVGAWWAKVRLKGKRS